jgi:EAL domain-containing protein (putative c-di-GMP-specific phosphodiesterase class I)
MPDDAERLLHLAFGADQRRYPIREDLLALVYRPIWDSARQLVLTYLCQPVPAAARDSSIDHRLCPALPHEQLALDSMVLRHAIAQIQSLQKDGCRVLLACPIHFATVANPQTWAPYARLLETAPEGVTRHLGLLVMDTEDSAARAGLVQEEPKLLPRVRFVYACYRNAKLLAATPGNGLHARGLELSAQDAGAAEQVKTLARAAEATRINSFVFGVSTHDLLQLATGSGVRFLEGKVIWPPVPAATRAFSWTVDSPDQTIVAI